LGEFAPAPLASNLEFDDAIVANARKIATFGLVHRVDCRLTIEFSGGNSSGRVFHRRNRIMPE
jgi:hypothetical protein